MTYDGGDGFEIHSKKKTFSKLLTRYVFAINLNFSSGASKSQGIRVHARDYSCGMPGLSERKKKHKIKDSIAQTFFVLFIMTMRYFITGLKIVQKATIHPITEVKWKELHANQKI